MWDITTGEQLLSLSGHSSWVEAVAVSPDGEKVISGSDDNTIKVWDITTGEQLLSLSGHSDWVEAVAVSPDGEKVISGSDDNNNQGVEFAT